MQVCLSPKLEGAKLEGILTPGGFHATPVDAQFEKIITLACSIKVSKDGLASLELSQRCCSSCTLHISRTTWLFSQFLLPT